MLSAWPEMVDIIQRGFVSNREACFVLNDSGGKDSQAMRILVLEALRRERVQVERRVIVAHATLGEVEWPGAMEHARAGAHRNGLQFLRCKARRTFFEMVEDRFAGRPDVPSFPSSAHRQCTSDLKRGPIRREVRRFARCCNWDVVVNCIGLRADESSSRAKKSPLVLNKALCTKSREWWDWLPIHGLSASVVFQAIKDAGEKPHYAYATGNERLSCVFCIMGSTNDLRNGAIRHPELYRKYVELETRTGYTMHQSRKSLPVLTGIEV